MARIDMNRLRFTSALALALALAVALGACAPSIRDDDDRPGSDDEEREANNAALHELFERGEPARSDRLAGEGDGGDELPVLPVTVLEPPPAAAETGEGVIDRSQLLRYIEQGPHHLLSSVQVAPVMEETAFRGFVVEGVADNGPYADSGLRVGDVVTAVNGRDISQPQQFIDVWDAMRDARRLDVDIIRGAEARTLSWRIE
jgi:hypothetical protein